MFDDLLLLGEHGRTVYMGPTYKLQKYFTSLGFDCPEKVNIADYVIDVCAGNVSSTMDVMAQELPEKWEVAYDGSLWLRTPKFSVDDDDSSSATSSTYKKPHASYFNQFFACLQRAIIQFMRTLGSFFLDNVLVFIAGLCLAAMFNNAKYIGPLPDVIVNQCPAGIRYMCSGSLSDPIGGQNGSSMLALVLVATMASLRVFGKEKAVFIREGESGLNVFSYFWAKDIAALPGIIVSPLIFMSLFYTVVQPHATFIEYYGYFFLVYWASYGLGYCISILYKPHIAQLAAVVHIFILNIISGAVMPWPAIQNLFVPLCYAPYISFLFYSYYVLYVIEIQSYEYMYDITKSLNGNGFTVHQAKFMPLGIVGLGLLMRFAALFMLWCSKPDSWYQSMTINNLKLRLVSIKEIIYAFIATKLKRDGFDELPINNNM
ncbi:ABCG28 [Acrasis kona]|uniref:ABCG28 n=1 Tax=Acrasis kona TaxID=1008807 RepID=A0AAW2YSX5_9EUKA